MKRINLGVDAHQPGDLHLKSIAFLISLLIFSMACSLLSTGRGKEPATAIPATPALVTPVAPTAEKTSTIAPAPTEPPPTEMMASCGNGICDGFENSSNCPADCEKVPTSSAPDSISAARVIQTSELPPTFYNGNDRTTPAVALSHDGQLVVNIQQPGQGNGPGEGRLYHRKTGTVFTFWKDQLVSTGAVWLFADPYLLRVSNAVPRGTIVAFPVYFAENDGTQLASERGHQQIAVVPGLQSAEDSLAGNNNDFYDPREIITQWDPQVSAVGWISAMDLSADGEVLYAVAPYVKGGKNHVALIQIAVYQGDAIVLDWQVQGGIVYPFGMLTTGEHGRTILVKGNARGWGMNAWVYTNDYVSKAGWYPIGGIISGENAAPLVTYEHVSCGPSYFLNSGGPIILGNDDYPWINVQYAPGEPITQLTWKENDSRVYTFAGGTFSPGNLRGRWSSYDGNHAVYHIAHSLIWHDFELDRAYRLDVSYQIPDSPESYNNYISSDATVLLLLKTDPDRANWRLEIVYVAPPG